MLVQGVCHHRICFDNRENEYMCTACCKATEDSAYFLRINFTDHHPRNDQIAERATNCKNEYARNGEPCGYGIGCKGSIIQISAESNHRQSTSNTYMDDVKRNNYIISITMTIKLATSTSHHLLDRKVRGRLPKWRIDTQPTMVKINRMTPIAMVQVFESQSVPDFLNTSTA